MMKTSQIVESRCSQRNSIQNMAKEVLLDNFMAHIALPTSFTLIRIGIIDWNYYGSSERLCTTL